MIMGAKSALFDRIASVVSDTEGVAHDEVTRALTPVSDLLSWAIGGAAIVVLAHVRGTVSTYSMLRRTVNCIEITCHCRCLAST